MLVTATPLAGRVSANSTTTVNIKNGSGSNQIDPGYSPKTVTVVIGVNATVMWANNDVSAHTVTGDNSSAISSGNLPAGQSYSTTFTSPGTYPYRCDYHSWMTGTVIVKSGSAVPEFPVATLAVIMFALIAVAALVSRGPSGKASSREKIHSTTRISTVTS